MTLQTLSDTYVPLHTYRYRPVRPSRIADFAGGGGQAAAAMSRELRQYPLEFHLTEAQRQTFDRFLADHGYGTTTFLWKDLKDFTRSGATGLVELTPAGDGATTRFHLPKLGEYGGDYFESASIAAFVNSVSTAISASDVDGRWIEFAAAPASSAVVTINYEYLRRVRQAQPIEWPEPVFENWPIALLLEERILDG